MYSHLKIQQKKSCVHITINRPKQLNALHKETLHELGKVLCEYKHDSSVKALVITGEGDKSFVAGADIKEFSDFNKHQGQQLSEFGHETVFNKIECYPKPVIARINGYALGGGLELALACHFRIASENAIMGLPEVSLGLIPGYGGTQRLVQLIGKTHATDMILTGRKITAKEANELRLLNVLTTQNELDHEVEKLIERLVQNSPVAISKAIKSMNNVFAKEGLQNETDLFGDCFGTSDFKEGVAAFLEKRKPQF